MLGSADESEDVLYTASGHQVYDTAPPSGKSTATPPYAVPNLRSRGGRLQNGDDRQLQNSTDGCIACKEDAPDQMGLWIRIFARIPLVHSLGWTLVFWGVLSPISTKSVDVVLAVFMTYGMIKFFNTGVGALYGCYMCHRNNSADPQYWVAKAKDEALSRPASAPSFSSVIHVLVIPNYKEPMAKLRETLSTVVEQTIAGQICVVMAMESRDPNAVSAAEELKAEFESKLMGFFYTVHEMAPGEAAGKSSNENWGVRCAKQLLVDELGLPVETVVVTTCDADTFFHPNHFAHLTYLFISNKDRYRRFWQAATNFMPNVLDVPAVCSVRYTLLSIGYLGQLANPFGSPMPLATYAVSLKLAVEAAFWDPTTIPEDWHMFFRCSFLNVKNSTPVKLVPMLMPVGNDCVIDDGYFKSINACFQQAMRWQWGAIDIGYVLVKCVRSGQVSLYSKVYALWNIVEHHLFYPVFWVALLTIVLKRALGMADDASPAEPAAAASLMDATLFTVETRDEKFDVTYHTVLSVFVVAFPLLNWTMMVGLDYALRYWVCGKRTGFHCTPDYKESLGCFSFLAHWWRAVKLMLFPLADLFLFTMPTMLAHSKMFVNSDLVYVTAPKGAGGPKPVVADEKTPLFQGARSAVGAKSV